jgi:2-polyprenyl-6-methoxyphenol hydroxylase-like FAD-dependent oxidoreductase
LEGTLISKVDFWIVGRDKPMVRLDLSVFARLSAAPGLLVLPQNRTEALLLEAVKAAGMTEILPGHQASAFEQDEDGVSVEVTGPAGGAQTYRDVFSVG